MTSDRDLLPLFIEETTLNTADFEAGLLQLERIPDDSETIALIFRLAHSLKGGSSVMGFTEVVAAEVRSLAQRSAEAAKEIKGLIQDTVRKVETGTALVNQSGQTLEEIVDAAKRVTSIVTEIAAAGREQASGIDQVNRAVTLMDRLTQSNAAQTEELSSTAQAPAVQAEQLQALVARFLLERGLGDGYTSSSSTYRPPIRRSTA